METQKVIEYLLPRPVETA